MTEGHNNHFCAGMYFIRRPDGRYELPGVTAARFPNEVKLPGGTCQKAPWETPEQTFVREFSEETGLTPVKFRMFHSDPPYNGHSKFFYVCFQVEGEFNGPKTVKETDGDELTIRLWELEEFNRHLFRNHRPAFMKACSVLKNADPSFERNYPAICEAIARAA